MLFTMGEMLIDFIALQKKSDLKEVTTFEKAPGGAPANVAVAVSKCGVPSAVITQLGQDAFGDYLIDVLHENGVNTSYIKRTTKANTGLAFVSVAENGERDFSFYRKPSADLLLEASEIKSDWFQENDYLHFGSVDLVESPMKESHRRAIQFVKSKQGIISFDPNVRLPLWHDSEACRQAILEFLPLANIVKISDEELTFITGEENEEKALQSLFVGDVQIVLYTKGSHGASILTKENSFDQPGYCVCVEDTTGAGDAFAGGFLYTLLHNKVTRENLSTFVTENHQTLLTFSNACGALTTTKRGAIHALPTLTQIKKFIDEQSV